MLIDFFLFPLFAASVSTIGLSFLLLARNALRLSISKTPAFLLPLLGAFSIGSVALIVNFFSGVAVSFSYTLLGALLIFGILNATQDDRRSIFLICLLAALCTPLAADMQPGPDAALYHIPHQKWIREREIVFGLANLHSRYGFSSMLEYINSLLWIGESFKLLSYMSALFFVSLLAFCYNAINDSNPVTRFLTILIVINMLVYDNFFIWKYGYADSPAGITLALSAMFGVYILETSEKKLPNLEGFLLAFLTISAMSVALKVSSILIVPWTAFVIIVVAREKRIALKRLFFVAVMPGLFAIIWTIRGVIISGCLLFPSSLGCLNVSWSAKELAIHEANWVTAWARHPHAGLYSLEDSSWLTNYWLSANKEFILFSLLAGTTVVFVAMIASHRFEMVKLRKIEASALVFFVFAAFVLWFTKAPTERFGIGVFLIAIPSIAVSVFGAPKFDIGMQTRIISLILVFFLADKQGGYSLKNLTKFHFLTVPTVETVEDPEFGVRPAEGGGDCWTARHCAPYDRPTPSVRSGYLFFGTHSE
ncbi:LIC_10190 family membrane protein [Roseibium album]|uniref:DUF8201 domain-containing protein n=1 Tax=Roseibium album TaxID=311410 RepID=A0A0M7AX02_9HYPH|nr:hypothetical protein [Roseibium album]CTQ61862.1 hypothetical protein LA5094_04644 [Roseibium album]CTQ75136.1 hypothetical protein LA5096_04244 [Roseibium album]CTQ78700.1 hypothetical protein LA5095_04459 [Roseibium album]